MKDKKKTWPMLGRLILRGRIFGVRKKSNALWVDVPSQTLYDFIRALSKISRSSSNLKTSKEDAKNLVEKFNEKLRSEGSEFIKIVRPQNANTKKYKYKIIIRPDFKKLEEFLEKLARDPSKSLPEKYKYVSSSRLPAINVIRRGGFFAELSSNKSVQDGVKRVAKKDIKQISKTLRVEIRKLDKCQKQAEKKYRTRKVHPFFFFVQPEIITILETCRTLSEKGLITSVYREFRKILEVLATNIFFDILRKNSPSVWEGPKMDITQWMDRKSLASVRSSREERLRDIDAFRRKINDLFKQVKICFDILDKEITKIEFSKYFTQGLSYPLFVILFGMSAKTVDGFPGDSSRYVINKDQLESPATKNFAKILALSIGKTKETKKEIKVAKSILDNFFKEKNQIIPQFLTTKFYIQYVESTSEISFYNKYSEYSMFVHSHPETFQVLPFSSVSEFKILREEAKKFVNLLEKITKWYFSEIFPP